MSDSAALSLSGRVGIIASGLCAVHCLALPVFLILAPGLASRWEWVEAWETPILLMSLILVGLPLFFRGEERPRKAIGMWLLAGAAFLATLVVESVIALLAVPIFLFAASHISRRGCSCPACHVLSDEEVALSES